MREATYPPAAVNVLDVSSESMAAFQVFLYGRFWVITEAVTSKQLKFCCLTFSKIRLNALWMFVAPVAPKIITFIRDSHLGSAGLSFPEFARAISN